MTTQDQQFTVGGVSRKFIDHVMSREDREWFHSKLGEARVKTGWEVHALCLMENHLHLVVETPQANLVAGMKWFLGTYSNSLSS